MKRANDFVVGLSVLGIGFALVGSTLWVKQADMGRRHSHVVARFHDVGNARVGNAAVVRGVRAGRIEAIELAPDGWVQLRLTVDPSVSLPQQPVVLLNETSLFGEWQATITERAAVPKDDAVLRQLAEASRGDDVLPGATMPDIAKLTVVAGQIAGDVANVANRVEVAFDETAARELRASIQNFAALSTTLAGSVRAHQGDLDTLSTLLQSAAMSLGSTAATAQRLASRVDSATTDGQVKQIVGDVAAAAAELRSTSAEIHDLTRQLARSQGRMERFLSSGDSVLVKINSGQGSLGLMVNDPGLYRNTDSLVVSLRALVSDMKANPKRYINVRIF